MYASMARETKKSGVSCPTCPAFGVWGAGSRVEGAGCRVQGLGFRVQGSGFRVQGSGFTCGCPASHMYSPATSFEAPFGSAGPPSISSSAVRSRTCPPRAHLISNLLNHSNPSYSITMNLSS